MVLQDISQLPEFLHVQPLNPQWTQICLVCFNFPLLSPPLRMCFDPDFSHGLRGLRLPKVCLTAKDRYEGGCEYLCHLCSYPQGPLPRSASRSHPETLQLATTTTTSLFLLPCFVNQKGTLSPWKRLPSPHPKQCHERVYNNSWSMPPTAYYKN